MSAQLEFKYAVVLSFISFILKFLRLNRDCRNQSLVAHRIPDKAFDWFKVIDESGQYCRTSGRTELTRMSVIADKHVFQKINSLYQCV